jgi:hypothetical protein
MSTLTTGSFTSNGTAVYIPIESGFDWFQMINCTDVTGNDVANTNVMKAFYSSQMPAGSAYYSTKTTGANTLDLEKFTASNGFTFWSDGTPDGPNVFPLVTITGVTSANPAAITTATAHNLAQGDTVRLFGLNGTMQSMSGLSFTVNSIVDSTHFTITFDSSNGGIGGTPATSGKMQKVVPNYFSPHNIVIGPTQTAYSGNLIQLNLNTVPVTDQGSSQYPPFQTPYQPGAYVRLNMPVGFGPTTIIAPLLCQVQGYAAKVNGTYNYQNVIQLSVVQTGQIAGNILTGAGLAPIVYPTGVAGYAGQFPLITDIAESATIFSEAEDNTGFRGIIVGTTVQTSGVLYQWYAGKGYTLTQGVFPGP